MIDFWKRFLSDLVVYIIYAMLAGWFIYSIQP